MYFAYVCIHTHGLAREVPVSRRAARRDPKPRPRGCGGECCHWLQVWLLYIHIFIYIYLQKYVYVNMYIFMNIHVFCICMYKYTWVGKMGTREAQSGPSRPQVSIPRVLLLPHGSASGIKS